MGEEQRETDGGTLATGRPTAVSELADLAEDVLPALIARLGVSGLGELEISRAGWRVRLRRETSKSTQRDGATSTAGRPQVPPGSAGPAIDTARAVTSPAVGYFTPRADLAVGQLVSSMDRLGWIDVLGVRVEVVAPADGAVGRLLVEQGQAVEYGQELIALDGTRAPTEGASA